MNDYEQKQEARRQHYLDMAHSCERKSDSHYEKSNQHVAGIEMGQPILVGHHSEKRHRNALDKCHNSMRRCIEEQDKAKYYREKAASVGSGGISSDDPDALIKLRAKLAGMQNYQEHMKSVNAAYRKMKKPSPDDVDAWQKVAELAGIDEKVRDQIRLYMARYAYHGAPFTYQLQNNNGNMKRVSERIAQLEIMEKAKEREPQSIEGDGFTISEHPEENRVWVEFDTRPSKEVCQRLRNGAFKWSPTRKAWIRQMTGNALYEARQLAKELPELLGGTA